MRQICKANELINAAYVYDHYEQRLLGEALSELDSRQQYKLDHVFIVSLEAFAKHMPHKSKVEAWIDMQDSAGSLFERRITIRPKVGETHTIRWLSEKIQIDHQQKRIGLVFGQRVMQYLTDLKGAFTTLSDAQVMDFKSIYTPRVYEWVKQYQNMRTNERVMDVSEIREKLELGDKLKQYSALRERVLESACKEITKKTDIRLTFEPVRVGKSVLRVKFKWKKKALKQTAPGGAETDTERKPKRTKQKRVGMKKASEHVAALRNAIGNSEATV